MSHVAVVTGANRGIGFEICRQLSRQGMHVVLTSRDEARGRVACSKLRQLGGSVDFHALDVTDSDSVEALTACLRGLHGGVQVLVNNAGVMLDGKGSRLADTSPRSLRQTMETNLVGPMRLIQAFLPMMKSANYGRIVNVSSGLGQLSEVGAGSTAYRISKAALNALTRIAAAEARGGDILVNAVCPGWVKTDMGGPHATRTVEQGADTAVWLATLPEGGASGGFFRDRRPIAW